ncbi:rhodanese-like domain-containing protein [Lederbergia galactosidilytica]|uniref:Sulfurtransferase n=1 Tax=Lederbergia galactosidilytica TaxID=217031 RepID=A0A177ZK01_9BACI|nr:rhodanese-like domain-containing protein [Lederbergia galactosidilytica]KRG16081.1 sulfurtransferase [Virgibacillus soli]MBP1915275.1 rhodanese-related sulfurtransferase [Lederbergia galactosidilytica]OAK68104.1 sulfurtransferase [Lederbergia galactosidilytica]
MSEIKTITPEELQKDLEAGKKYNLVDVREDEEVAEGMISDAVHIPMGQIPEHLDHFDPNQEYIVICRSGGRSGRTCEYLNAQGYNVTNMVGGMLKWQGETTPKEK